MEVQTKVEWEGKIRSIQPRTNVWRYLLDNRTHSHIGYNLFLAGSVDGIDAEFTVAISEKQQQSGRYRIGDILKGTAWTKKYPKWEFADYYRAGALKHIRESKETIDESNAPPWIMSVPDMQTYEWRGARMLSLSCWKGKCFQCMWANMANVTIEYDWGKIQKHRFESFCYGPKTCKFYKMGRPRAVPYKGMGSNYDEGWLDDICTERREDDE